MGTEQDLYNKYSPEYKKKKQKEAEDRVKAQAAINSEYYRNLPSVYDPEGLKKIREEGARRQLIIDAAKAGKPMPSFSNPGIESFIDVINANNYDPLGNIPRGPWPSNNESAPNPNSQTGGAPPTDKDLLLKHILDSNKGGSSTQPKAEPKSKSKTGTKVKSTEPSYPKAHEDKSISSMLKTYLKLAEDESKRQNEEFAHKAKMEQLAMKKELEGNFEQNKQAAADTAGANAFAALVPAIMGWGANPQSVAPPQLPDTASELPNQEAIMTALQAQGTMKQDNAQANLLAQIAAKEAAMNNSAQNNYYNQLMKMQKMQFDNERDKAIQAGKDKDRAARLKIAYNQTENKDTKAALGFTAANGKAVDKIYNDILNTKTTKFANLEETDPVLGKSTKQQVASGIPLIEILENGEEESDKMYGKGAYSSAANQLANKASLLLPKIGNERWQSEAKKLVYNISRKIPNFSNLSYPERKSIIEGVISDLATKDPDFGLMYATPAFQGYLDLNLLYKKNFGK